MESLRASYLRLCEKAAFRDDELLEGLRIQGIEVKPYQPGVCDGPCIVTFDGCTPEVENLVRRWSADGLQRLVALAASRMVLLGGATWRLMQAGASDVLAWEPGGRTVTQLAARFSHWQVIDGICDSAPVRDALVGSSAPWQRVRRQIVEVAHGASPILVLGETGTGKELVAKIVHALDPRGRGGPLQVLDCTTIVPELSGSELFGHERGAFTHAVSAREGAFALANGGTLFLDEVGDLPLSLQGQLLRVLQEHVYKRVGGNTWHRSEFRLICATNRDLPSMVEHGAFRRDLYYRVASAIVHLPPLRARREDIAGLVASFARQLCPAEDALDIDDAVQEYLVQRNYAGNVRELRQLVSRILDRHVGPGPVTVGDLPEDERPAMSAVSGDWRDELFDQVIRRALAVRVPLKALGRAVVERAVEIAVADQHGNLQRAARVLGVTDRALQVRRASAPRGLPSPKSSQAAS